MNTSGTKNFEEARKALRERIIRTASGVRNSPKEAEKRAFRTLISAPDPASESICDYDHLRYGPLLGISDEGSATETIAEAATKSPKAIATGSIDPSILGMAIDAERMTAAGEVPVGPREYESIHLGAAGRLLITTNVGVRANVRYFQRYPLVLVDSKKSFDLLSKEVEELISPFWKTPKISPRPITVYLKFDSSVSFQRQRELLTKSREHIEAGTLGDRRYHRVGLACDVSQGATDIEKSAVDAINLARTCGIEEVQFEGELREQVARSLSLPGLLNYFGEDTLTRLQECASTEPKVTLSPSDRIDLPTVARNVWSGLQTAYTMGAHLGKYGLVPLTLEEQEAVIQDVQAWFPDWSPVPAYYVDHTLVTGERVLTPSDAKESAMLWLRMAQRAGAKLVLFDSPGRIEPRRLLKSHAQDNAGVLEESELAELQSFGAKLGIKLLWAGGVSTRQVFELGEHRVFGVYTTSTTATESSLSPSIALDPHSPYEREPSLDGILEVKALLEAGFLSSQAQLRKHERSIRDASSRLLAAREDSELNTRAKVLEELTRILVSAWEDYLLDEKDGV